MTIKVTKIEGFSSYSQ